jgi:hypothetical protein
MDKKKEQKLLEEFPDIFRDYYEKDITQSCMPWGICCGNGWYDLLRLLCLEITILSRDKNIQVIADQVKEKFGGLRFYFHIKNPSASKFWWVLREFFYKCRLGRQYNFILDLRRKFWRSTEEKIFDIVMKAEQDSYKICEQCGQPGKTRGGGWVRTLCEKCEKDYKKDYI